MVVDIIQSILELGPVVMLPIMILLLGLFFRMKLGKALKAGLFVGIGFQGLNLVINLLMSSISPATEYYKAMGSGFTTVDVGFAAIGGASWGVAFAPIAVLILIPRMVSIMMEGLSVIGSSAQEYMREKIGDDAELNIGMDIALGLGDPTVVTVTVLCLPIVILFAFIIPNMSYFPVGLLGGVCYVIPMCAMASDGNVLRTFISSAVNLFFIVLLSNYFAPEATSMMKITGVEVSGMVTDGFFGYNIGNILIGLLSKFVH